VPESLQGDYASAEASGNAGNRGARTLDVDHDYVDGISEPGKSEVSTSSTRDEVQR
jgi:hypothetical protein